MKVDLIQGENLEFILLEPMKYDLLQYGVDDIVVPKKFKSDGASVPRFFWRILPPFGIYLRAAILHDYLYRSGLFSKEYSDHLLGSVARQDDTPYWQIAVIEFGLWLGGQNVWEMYRELQAAGIDCVFLDNPAAELQKLRTKNKY